MFKHSKFTVFLFYKGKKELFTGEGCDEMDIPWQLCRTIGPLLRDSPWQVLKDSQGGDLNSNVYKKDRLACHYFL